MNNKLLHFTVFIVCVILSACGVKDQKSTPSGELQSSVVCEARPVLMRELESYSFSWQTPNQSVSTSAEINVGNTETYLDWGTLTSTGDRSAVYTAPAFVPESRTVRFDVFSEGESKSIGSCPIYLLAAGTFGATDDGIAKGLTASVYPVPIGTIDTAFPTLNGAPVEKSVLYQFDWVNSSGLKGLSIASQYVAIVFSGTLTLPASTDYVFRLQANRFANFFLNDKLMVTSLNNNAAESSTLAYNLTAGKYRVRMEYHMTSPSPFSLKLDWKKRATPTTFEPYAVVPYSSFDRD